MPQKILVQANPVNMMDEDDILAAMKEFGSYLDISPDDFRAIYAMAYTKVRTRLLEGITARDIMSHPAISVPPDMRLRDAVDFLDEHNISGVPVTNDKQLVGLLSETDIARIAGGTRRPTPMHLLRVVIKNTFDPSFLDTQVENCMTKNVISVLPNISLSTMITLIQKHDINRLPVTDDKNNLLGLVSRTDILNTLSKLR